VVGATDAALALLTGYDWPGNVRQLENAVYRAIVLSDGAYLETVDFPQIVAHRAGREEAARQAAAAPGPSAPVHIDEAMLPSRAQPRENKPSDRFLGTDGEVAALADIERELIVFALRHYGNRMSKAARALGIGRSTLYRKLKDYGLDGEVESDAA
jgi:DNA-binding NtrC family response regulator